jgi:hypothetical protein
LRLIAILNTTQKTLKVKGESLVEKIFRTKLIKNILKNLTFSNQPSCNDLRDPQGMNMIPLPAERSSTSRDLNITESWIRWVWHIDSTPPKGSWIWWLWHRNCTLLPRELDQSGDAHRLHPPPKGVGSGGCGTKTPPYPKGVGSGGCGKKKKIQPPPKGDGSGGCGT